MKTIGFKSFIFILIFAFYCNGQEEYIVNQTKFINKLNPSAFGMNQLNRVGVLRNTLKIDETSTLNNSYVFGSLGFPDKNFSIGFDINQFSMGDALPISTNSISVSYVYKIQVSGYSFLLPALTGRFVSSEINSEKLTFGDQLNATTGQILVNSSDPLAQLISNIGYADFGASVIYHSDVLLLGLSLKNLSRPNHSYNKEDEDNKLPLRISVQGGYEFDLNPYERRFLPRFSYLFAYMSFVKFGSTMYMSLAQDFQLGEFNVGFTQQMGSVESFSVNNFGITIGTAMENFDFGIHYNFPFKTPGVVYSPSMFELSVIFDFSIFRRNNRGLYKRLQIDNYY